MARFIGSPSRASRATAIASGSSAMPTPCMARPATSTPYDVGTIASAVPAVTTISPTRIVGRRSRPLANRPTIGVATAPASRVAVSDHCAVVRRTSYASAMRGTSGAPSGGPPP